MRVVTLPSCHSWCCCVSSKSHSWRSATHQPGAGRSINWKALNTAYPCIAMAVPVIEWKYCIPVYQFKIMAIVGYTNDPPINEHGCIDGPCSIFSSMIYLFKHGGFHSYDMLVSRRVHLLQESSPRFWDKMMNGTTNDTRVWLGERHTRRLADHLIDIQPWLPGIDEMQPCPDDDPTKSKKSKNGWSYGPLSSRRFSGLWWPNWCVPTENLLVVSSIGRWCWLMPIWPEPLKYPRCSAEGSLEFRWISREKKHTIFGNIVHGFNYIWYGFILTTSMQPSFQAILLESLQNVSFFCEYIRTSGKVVPFRSSLFGFTMLHHPKPHPQDPWLIYSASNPGHPLGSVPNCVRQKQNGAAQEQEQWKTGNKQAAFRNHPLARPWLGHPRRTRCKN